MTNTGDSVTASIAFCLRQGVGYHLLLASQHAYATFGNFGKPPFDSLRIDNLSRHRLNEVRKRFGMLFQSSALFEIESCWKALSEIETR